MKEDEKDTAIITSSMCDAGSLNAGNETEIYQYVLVVGYDGNAYTIKNSLGSAWGYLGYAKIDAT